MGDTMSDTQPLYLRNKVAYTKAERAAMNAGGDKAGAPA